MKPVLVLYATREGQTRRIAERIAETARKRGDAAEVLDAAELEPGFMLDAYRAAVLAASVHAGKHEPEMVAFAKRHRRQLEQMPAAFISVSLTEAGAEDPSGSPEHREESRQNVERMLEEFFEQTGWHPARYEPVAGALPYTQYNPIKRFIMKQIVKHQGGSTDTSRDHEYTDWPALDRFAEEFLAATRPTPTAVAPDRSARAGNS